MQYFKKRDVRLSDISFLCADHPIPLTVDYIHHVGIRICLTGHHLGKQTRIAAGNQCDTLLIHLYRLLLITGLDIPEHNMRKLIAIRTV